MRDSKLLVLKRAVVKRLRRTSSGQGPLCLRESTWTHFFTKKKRCVGAREDVADLANLVLFKKGPRYRL